MYGIMTKISSVSSQNQLLMLKNAPEFTKIMIGEICTSLELNVEKFFFFVHTSSVNHKTMYGQKKEISTFSSKLVQISPIMILVNSGAFLSISSWFCALTELIFVMIIHFFYWLAPQNAKDYGSCASSELTIIMTKAENKKKIFAYKRCKLIQVKLFAAYIIV